MRKFQGIPELAKASGTHLGYSDWHTVTQDQVDAFARATGDHQWIHVDAQRAKQGPFRQTIAHGYLTLSLVPRLIGEVYETDGVMLSVNYGANRLRFPSPVPVDSRVRAGVELLEVGTARSGGSYQVVTRVTVERAGGEKPVCVVELVSVVVPDPDWGAAPQPAESHSQPRVSKDIA